MYFLFFLKKDSFQWRISLSEASCWLAGFHLNGSVLCLVWLTCIFFPFGERLLFCFDEFQCQRQVVDRSNGSVLWQEDWLRRYGWPGIRLVYGWLTESFSFVDHRRKNARLFWNFMFSFHMHNWILAMHMIRAVMLASFVRYQWVLPFVLKMPWFPLNCLHFLKYWWWPVCLSVRWWEVVVSSLFESTVSHKDPIVRI